LAINLRGDERVIISVDDLGFIPSRFQEFLAGQEAVDEGAMSQSSLPQEADAINGVVHLGKIPYYLAKVGRPQMLHMDNVKSPGGQHLLDERLHGWREAIGCLQRSERRRGTQAIPQRSEF
jgi:hypothetical protein